MHHPAIIYADNHIAVIYKPAGLPVHKNNHMPNDAPYLTKWAGQYFNASVYNVHRLDAKTSGLVVLAFDSKIANLLTTQFARQEVKKSYTAIVRGVLSNEGLLEKPVLNKKKGKLVNARTAYKTLKTIETNISYKTFNNISISLVTLYPETGRWHQLRQQLAFERNDIIGDNQHGDRMLNHIIEDLTGEKKLYLHACSLGFMHPEKGIFKVFEAPAPDAFDVLMDALG